MMNKTSQRMLDLDVVSILDYGVFGSGSDESAEIQSAIDDVAGSNVVLYFPAGNYNLGATGITIPEGTRLIGAGRDTSGLYGTKFIYSGTGNAIAVDGEWVGFDSRRNIEMSGFYVATGNSANAGIYCDFLTISELSDIHIEGTPTYGIYMINSYNNVLRRIRTRIAGTGLYMSIKPAPDDVFSGQTLVEQCDFWDSTVAGVTIQSSVNIMAGVRFDRCHFLQNEKGVYIEGANAKDIVIDSCHFEANDTYDLHVASTVIIGPTVINCHCNQDSLLTSFFIEGDNGEYTNNEFAGLLAGSTVINVTGDYNRIIANKIRQAQSQALASAITLAGDYNSCRDSMFVNAVSGVMDCLNITGNYNRVSNILRQNVTSGIFTDSGQNTIVEDKVTFVSEVFDLSAAGDRETFPSYQHDLFIYEARVMYTEATSADAGVQIRAGRKVPGGGENITNYLDRTSDVSAAYGDEFAENPAATFLDGDYLLVLSHAGGKTGAGEFRLQITAFPWSWV